MELVCTSRILVLFSFYFICLFFCFNFKSAISEFKASTTLSRTVVIAKIFFLSISCLLLLYSYPYRGVVGVNFNTRSTSRRHVRHDGTMRMTHRED